MRISDWSSDVCSSDLTGAFGMEGVDGAVPERRDRILDKAAFIQRVGMDGDLDIMLLGDIQAVVDGGRRGAPVFMQLQADRKSVVEGKSVSVRVDIVGRRIIKKKKHNETKLEQK